MEGIGAVLGLELLLEPCGRASLVRTNGGEPSDVVSLCLPPWSHPTGEVPNAPNGDQKVHFLAVPGNVLLRQQAATNWLIFWWHRYENAKCDGSQGVGFKHVEGVLQEEAGQRQEQP